MRPLIALIAGLAFGAAPSTSEGATFTPDMWVYELTLTAASFDSEVFVATAEASADADVPEGCDVYPRLSGKIGVFCNDFVPPELDALSTIDTEFSDFLSITGRIGFNASTVVCDAWLIGRCPTNGKNSPEEEWPDFLGDYFFEKVTFDASAGYLSYCGFRIAAEHGCYELAPHGVTVGEYIFMNGGTTFGTFEFGDGGTWFSSGDSYFLYSGTGRLLSAPVPVVAPLPAPLLMLASGLAALGLARAGGRRRKAARVA